MVRIAPALLLAVAFLGCNSAEPPAPAASEAPTEFVQTPPVSSTAASAAATKGMIATPEPALLFAGATNGDAEQVRRLLDSGADADAAGPGNRTALTAAAYGGHAEVVRLLLESGADVDAQDDTRANALLSTGETGNVEVLREVLKANPDLARTNRFGGTALIPAADRGHIEVVRLQLTTDMDIDHVNNLGWTALLEAVILGEGGAAHTEIVRMLIDGGANVNLGDSAGVRPLGHARQRGFTPIVRLLEAAGAR